MTGTRFPTHEAEERLRALRGGGVEPVPLHGTPSPALPPHVVDAVAAALGRPQSAPPARGLVELRSALSRWVGAGTGRTPDPETELLVTNGAMHALGVCFRAILERDDEVLVPAPCFFFDEPIRAAGGVPVHVHGSAETAWAWDAAALEHAVRPTTRALLLCNPVNPTGHVPARDEVQAVIAVAARHDLLVVTDEAYEASLWDGGALSSAYGAAPRAILIRSLGKSLSMPQLRLGLLAGPPAEIERCARVLEWDCLRVGLAAQVAALAALVGPTEWLEVVHASMVRSRDMALAAVGDVSGLSVVAPSGGPFLFVGADGRESLAEELLAVGLPVVDGRHFHASGFARLPFGGAEGACDALVAALAAYAERRASRRR